MMETVLVLADVAAASDPTAVMTLAEEGESVYDVTQVDPALPPGVAEHAGSWMAWIYGLAMLCGVVGLLGGGVMMAIGKFGSRSTVASDGMRQWAAAFIGGLMMVTAAEVMRGVTGW